MYVIKIHAETVSWEEAFLFSSHDLARWMCVNRGGPCWPGKLTLRRAPRALPPSLLLSCAVYPRVHGRSALCPLVRWDRRSVRSCVMWFSISAVLKACLCSWNNWRTIQVRVKWIELNANCLDETEWCVHPGRGHSSLQAHSCHFFSVAKDIGKRSGWGLNNMGYLREGSSYPNFS